MSKNGHGMNIDKIIECLKKDNSTNRVVQTEFVKFMEDVNNPYLVLICCILSLRTNDKTTYPCSMRMLELGKTPEEISKLDVETLSKAIYPVGFYQNKAEQIINLSKELVEKYNSKVPDEIEELVKFKGVGRKTANLVLTKGFNKPAICVDVHVHRISNRLGYVETKNPEETEFALREKLPKKYWIDFNTLLVTHGQNICKPTKPNCANCSIEKYCKKRI
jgi:endonuclease-3